MYVSAYGKNILQTSQSQAESSSEWILLLPVDPLYAEYLGCYSVPEASLDHSSGRDWYVSLCCYMS